MTVIITIMISVVAATGVAAAAVAVPHSSAHRHRSFVAFFLIRLGIVLTLLTPLGPCAASLRRGRANLLCIIPI